MMATIEPTQTIDVPGILEWSIAVLETGELVNRWANDEGNGPQVGRESEYELTEAAIAALLLKWRADRALEALPALVRNARSRIIAPERGEVDHLQWAPMAVTPASVADVAYGTILAWSFRWAATLDVVPPRRSPRAWMSGLNGRQQGFRAGTTPQAAERLVEDFTMWLHRHQDDIFGQPDALEYFAVVVDLTRRLRQFAPRHKSTRNQTAPCPRCGYHAVRTDWMPAGEGERVYLDEHEGGLPGVLYDVVTVVGIDVKCTACGWAPPASEISRWLS